MGIIQRADLPERIRRAFGIREAGVGSTVSPEIVPVAVVEDLTGPAIDTGFPRSAISRGAVGASVGVYSEMFLINPEGSRVDVILEMAWLRNLTSATDTGVRAGTVGQLNNMLGTQTLTWNTDQRLSAKKPNAYIDSRNQAAAVGTLYLTLIGLSTSTYLEAPLNITLGPGDWVSFTPSIVNAGIDTWFFWYERLRTTT